ncbi:MAG: hypothetical protein II406_07105 [Bacteroidales bacterium]|nr:hypothetical protein [Bacteroidales bacterium]
MNQTKAWKMKKGFLIGGGILLAGILLQITVGPVRWERLAFPVNLILLIGFLAVMAFMYAFRQKVVFSNGPCSWRRPFPLSATHLS